MTLRARVEAAAKRNTDPCAYPTSEQNLLSCRQREVDRAETAISKIVLTLTKSYSADVELAEVFSSAQAKWREFRDAECKLKTYDSRGGTAFESFWLECLANIDRERVKTLIDMRDHP